jgi:DNA-binding transcriptional regulator YdaS (Cro superfamily)
MAAPSVYIRAVQKAIEITGGRKALAERLGVKPTEIEKWLDGKAQVPHETFLRIIDIVIEELAPPGEPDSSDPPSPRSSSPFPRRDCD